MMDYIATDGCTDATACNFDPTAICDDGSCEGLLGCNDPNVCNYNPAANWMMVHVIFQMDLGEIYIHMELIFQLLVQMHQL